MVDRVGDIIAFSSLCNTTVYAYCNCYSDQGWRWLPYKLLTGHQTNYPCVYLVNKHGHFEPVLDVQEDVSPLVFLWTVDTITMFHKKLVNSASDEQKLRDFEDIRQSSTYLHQTIH